MNFVLKSANYGRRKRADKDRARIREHGVYVLSLSQGMRIVYGSNKGETEERAQRGLTFLGRLCNNEAVTTSAHA